MKNFSAISLGLALALLTATTAYGGRGRAAEALLKERDRAELTKRSTKFTCTFPSTLPTYKGLIIEERTWFHLGRTPGGTITEMVPPLRVAGAIPLSPPTPQEPETIEDVE